MRKFFLTLLQKIQKRRESQKPGPPPIRSDQASTRDIARLPAGKIEKINWDDKLETGIIESDLLTVKIALEHGANPNQEISSSYLPLNLASQAQYLNLPILRCLKEAGADIFLEGSCEKSRPLLSVAELPKRSEYLTFFAKWMLQAYQDYCPTSQEALLAKALEIFKELPEYDTSAEVAEKRLLPSAFVKLQEQGQTYNQLYVNSDAYTRGYALVNALLLSHLYDRVPLTPISPLFFDFIAPLGKEEKRESFFKASAAFSHEDTFNVQDMTDDFTRRVLLPSFLLRCKNLVGDQRFHEFLEHITLPSILEAELEIFAPRTLLKEKSLPVVLQLSKNWHRAENAFPNSLRPLANSNRSWHSMTEEKIINGAPHGYHIVCLTSEQELRNETRVLGHCVGRGRHASQCLGGNFHIFSIRDEHGTPISTFEIGNFDNIRFLQHEGRKGTNLTQEAIDTHDWFKKNLRRSIALNNPPFEKFGETPESREAYPYPRLLYDVGFEIEEANVEAAFDFYKENIKCLREIVPLNPLSDDFSKRGEPYLVRSAPIEKEAEEAKNIYRYDRLIDGPSMNAKQWIVHHGLDKVFDRIIARNWPYILRHVVPTSQEQNSPPML